MNSTSKMAETKQLLVDFGTWQVCRFTDVDGHTELYGVHTRCVNQDGFRTGVYEWGWTLSDQRLDVAEFCFNCTNPVPPEVVALIILLKSTNTE